MGTVSIRGAKKLQDELESFALSLPEAWFDTPWDDSRVSKVRKAIFAFYGTQDAPSVGLKLIDSHEQAIKLPGATEMHYDLGDDGWVSIPIAGLDDSAVELLHAFVEESYRLIAPRALVKQLNEELAD